MTWREANYPYATEYYEMVGNHKKTERTALIRNGKLYTIVRRYDIKGHQIGVEFVPACKKIEQAIVRSKTMVNAEWDEINEIDFSIQNDQPKKKAQPVGENDNAKQMVLLTGLNCLEGQKDLF